MLRPFKAGQAHGIHTDRTIFTEPLGCLACLYSQEGEPHTLQAAWLSVCLCVAPIMAPVPLCVSVYLHPHQGVPTCLRTRGEQSRKTARTLYNITWFCMCKPTSCHGNSLSDPVSRLWEHYLSGYGNTASLTQTPGCGSQPASPYSTIPSELEDKKGWNTWLMV